MPFIFFQYARRDRRSFADFAFAAALLVTVTQPCPDPAPDRTLHAVYKPTIGERPLDDFPDGTLALAQVDLEVRDEDALADRIAGRYGVERGVRAQDDRPLLHRIDAIARLSRLCQFGINLPRP